MSKTYESIYKFEDGREIIIARGSKDYVKSCAQMSQFVPYTIREFQTPENVRADYRDWRKGNNNRKPNRVIVKMRWEDGDNTEKGYQIDTIGIAPENYWIDHDNAAILFWVSTIQGLIDLMQPGNGSDFIVDEVLEFYKI
jgi:hypothetical protein